jgi:hypothetical protein
MQSGACPGGAIDLLSRDIESVRFSLLELRHIATKNAYVKEAKCHDTPGPSSHGQTF